jgi:hypothetical protein
LAIRKQAETQAAIADPGQRRQSYPFAIRLWGPDKPPSVGLVREILQQGRCKLMKIARRTLIGAKRGLSAKGGCERIYARSRCDPRLLKEKVADSVSAVAASG